MAIWYPPFSHLQLFNVFFPLLTTELLFSSKRRKSKEKRAKRGKSMSISLKDDLDHCACKAQIDWSKYRTNNKVLLFCLTPESSRPSSDLWRHWLMSIINWSKCTTQHQTWSLKYLRLNNKSKTVFALSTHFLMSTSAATRLPRLRISSFCQIALVRLTV